MDRQIEVNMDGRRGFLKKVAGMVGAAVVARDAKGAAKPVTQRYPPMVMGVSGWMIVYFDPNLAELVMECASNEEAEAKTRGRCNGVHRPWVAWEKNVFEQDWDVLHRPRRETRNS